MEYSSIEDLKKKILDRLSSLNQFVLKVDTNDRFINLSYYDTVKSVAFLSKKFVIDDEFIEDFLVKSIRYDAVTPYLPHQRVAIETQDFKDFSIYYVKVSDFDKIIVNTKAKSIKMISMYDICRVDDSSSIGKTKIEISSEFKDLQEIPDTIISMQASIADDNLKLRKIV